MPSLLVKISWQILLLTGFVVLSPSFASTAVASTDATLTPPLPPELGKPEDDNLKIKIIRFEVESLPTLDRATLDSLTAPYLGDDKGYEDLVNAAAAVTRYMQTTLGYYTGFAYVPAQKQANGVIKLQALEGRLDSVAVVIEKGARSEEYRALVFEYLASLKNGEPLYTAEIERVVLLLNDIAGLDVRAELEPGTYPGTVKVKIQGMNSNHYRARVGLDSRGTRASGLYRASLDLNSSGVISAGDTINIALSTSHTGDFKQATLGYTLPIGTKGWKLGTVASQVRYRGETSLWDWKYSTKGSANIVGANAIYPLIRSRDLNTFGVLTYQRKSITDRSSASSLNQKKSDGLIVGIVGDSRDSIWGGGITTYSAQLGWGKIDYGKVAATTDRIFRKISWSMGRLQNIVPKHFQLYTKFQGQVSDSELDNSEHFVAGGYNGVRAFPSGAGAGDAGYLISTELRWLPSTEWLGDIARNLRFSVFYDWAKIDVGSDAPWAYSREKLERQRQYHYTISGYGIGTTWESPKAISLQMNLAWQGRQDIANYSRGNSVRFNFALNKSF